MSRDRDEEKRDEEFASRWSRLKRETRAPAGGAPETPPTSAGEAADERSDEEILRELGLPDPDTLKPGDDIKGFMASAVPARLRNRVLRKLWVSNPVLANLDRLVDYDDDFTDAAMVPEFLNTAYKVGRGWLEDDAKEKSAEEPQREAPQAVEAGTPGAEAEGDTEAAEAAPPDPTEGGGEEVPADGESATWGTDSAGLAGGRAHSPLPRRRMRFRFSDG